MMLSLYGDAIVAVLLIVTIGYAAVLNRRLGVLRSDRARFEELMQSLTAAAQRAEAGVAALKSAAEDGGRRLEKKIEQAQRLYDDIGYLAERGGAIADRLEGTIRARRDESRPQPVAERLRDPDPEPALRGRERARGAEPRAAAADLRPGAVLREPSVAAPSRAERELLRALSGR